MKLKLLFVEGLKAHFIDWIITAVITFFSVKSATKQYYYYNRKTTAKNILELGLRLMFSLDYSEPLPDSAKAIFVEYGKSSALLFREQFRASNCEKRGINDLRKTVTSCGNLNMEISKFRPRDYGVLGLANKKSEPLLFDFNRGQLFSFKAGKIVEYQVMEENNFYVAEGHILSKKENQRSVMIAIPIIEDYSGSKAFGGVTFDMVPSVKTIYQEPKQDDTEEIKQRKYEANKKVFEIAVITAGFLKTAYFSKKERESK